MSRWFARSCKLFRKNIGFRDVTEVLRGTEGLPGRSDDHRQHHPSDKWEPQGGSAHHPELPAERLVQRRAPNRPQRKILADLRLGERVAPSWAQYSSFSCDHQKKLPKNQVGSDWVHSGELKVGPGIIYFIFMRFLTKMLTKNNSLAPFSLSLGTI